MGPRCGTHELFTGLWTLQDEIRSGPLLFLIELLLASLLCYRDLSYVLCGLTSILSHSVGSLCVVSFSLQRVFIGGGGGGHTVTFACVAWTFRILTINPGQGQIERLWLVPSRRHPPAGLMHKAVHSC